MCRDDGRALVDRQPGALQSEQQLALAREVGLKWQWVQFGGAWKEHFDLMRGRIRRAQEEGAVEITRRELARILREKREVMRAAGED